MIPDECRGTALYLEHVSRYRFAAQFARGKRVLDAATGEGYGAALLAEAGAASVVGVDVEPQVIALAAARYQSERVRFEVDDVTRLASIADESIDLLVALETIEHLANGADLVRQAARVLAPDGLFIVSTPNEEVSHAQNPFHTREYRAGELTQLLDGHFPHVRLFVQRTLFANCIVPHGPDDAAWPAPANPTMAGRALAAEVQFDAPGEQRDSASAPYFLALASRAPIPGGGTRVVVGVANDTEAKNRHIQILEDGVAERDAEIAARSSRLAEASSRLQSLSQSRASLTRRVEEMEPRIAGLEKDGEQKNRDIQNLEGDGERKNRYIQNLEGGVAERDRRIKDLEIALGRREMVFALAVVRAMIRVNRMLGRVPSRLARRAFHAFRRAPATAPHPLGGRGGPLVSLLVPVYNNADFLESCLTSALDQTWADYEVVVYDDASTDPRVRPILDRHAFTDRLRVVFGAENLGISRATNQAIALARGEFVAFLDCDDMLDKSALERVARVIRSDPGVDFVYTNRVDVDDGGREVERWDFTNRSLGPPDRELLVGMFASHLKVIRRAAFSRTGLFRAEFDSVQDYDIALRMSECARFAFLGEPLYRHRVHSGQTTQRTRERQQGLAERAKARAVLRRRLAAGECDELVSIVILSLNRVEDTLRCLEAIERYTPFRHEIILVDNGSQPEQLARLREAVAGRANTQLHALVNNLGVGGGRNHGVTLARGEYVVFLDNDIEVADRWLARLLEEIESDPRVAACCCRVVFPDGTIQFNGGATVSGAQRVRFNLIDTGRRAADLGTLEHHECDWVPGGATIFRRSVLVAIPYDTSIEGAYEDNDWSMAARQAGHRLVNAPLATVIHHHINFSAEARRDLHYLGQRYNKERLERTLRRFHEKHGLFIDEEDLYRFIGYEGSAEFIEATLASARTKV